jgi:catechol 2,3-dioxygenase-like lactoylglutathione lyase family enzyme
VIIPFARVEIQEVMSFKVAQIDHVHVYVSDRYEAAQWYGRVLGLSIVEGHEDWAADPNGPLTISSDGGNTGLALFQRANPVPPAQRTTIAFRVDAEGFRGFLARLAEQPVYDEGGQQVAALEAIDHDHSFSVYFCDPYGNPYEITSYDYAALAATLKK